ncbi:MAG TPA: ribonuclease P protein component [Ginsengibacter sp.]|nr:ribonuclease P protein component [Ginsengibacter sp.]
MALESACQPLTDVKYWLAAEKKGAISLQFRMNTEVKNKLNENIFMNSLITGLFFYFSTASDSLINQNLNILPRLTFKRDEKLKSLKVIQHIFKEGKSFSHFPLRIIYTQPGNNLSHLQAAFSVSSKNFKKAVQRNRIKRMMREAYRLQKTLLKNQLEENQKYLVVFIIYNGNILPKFDDIFEKMGLALQQLLKITSS